MTFEAISVERRRGAFWIYLARPIEMNAMNSQMMIEMAEALSIARNDDSVTTVVLTGKGRAFCAGADLKGTPDPKDISNGEPSFFDHSDKMFAILGEFPKPVIAALNGVACAGGLEIALCADVIFAARTARIGDVHSNYGLLPGVGGSVRLTRAVGPQRARYLMFSGDLLSAEEACTWGLVAKVVDAASLEVEAQAFADKLAGKSALGLRAMKRLIRDTADQSLEIALRYEGYLQRDHFRSPDVAEGLASFREKRVPNFSRRVPKIVKGAL